MGLAASQARLLTITSRKSDCEYQSMALSHQKIALSRDMNIVSAEYQDALNKTKLVYDFYGTGDKSTQLSYDLLMKPSELNDYMPSPITDPAGRVVLDAGLAAAAEAAGIPQEGLGCTPSSDLRNRFIDGLIDNGVISRTVGNGVKSVQYNPNAGFGTSEYLTTYTRTITFEDFIEEYLDDVSYSFQDLTLDAGGSILQFYDIGAQKVYRAGAGEGNDESNFVVSLKDLLEGNYALFGLTWDHDKLDEYGGRTCIVDKVGSSSLWDTLFDSLGCAIDPNDTMAQAALEYAKQQTLQKVISYGNDDFSNAAYRKKSNHASMGKVEKEIKGNTNDYVGYVSIYNKKNSDDYNDAYALNLTNMAKAFYTYFAMYMEGLASTNLKVTKEKATSTFVTSMPGDFAFNVLEDVDTTGNNLLTSNFYDTLFNQIATRGWVKNENIHDNEYLQTMLQNGSMYMTTLSDDDYYYQSNYATYKYVKEVTDEEFIAQAEAKYLREKEKIQGKENILDMKMKNLDTEISALTTEYDTVKSVISNGVKTSFTRYDA